MTVSQQMKACLEITVSKQKLNLKFTNAKNIYLAEDHFVNICRVAGKIICSSLVFSCNKNSTARTGCCRYRI